MFLLITLFASTTYSARGNKYLIGDVDGNGLIDIVDVVKIGMCFGMTYNNIHGLEEGEFNPDADLNQDGTIDIVDLSMCSVHFGEISDWHLANTDFEVVEQETHWAKSHWGDLSNIHWYFGFFGKPYMTMTDKAGWNGVGLFQGRKPFGWGTAPWEFEEVVETKTQRFDWRGMKDYSNLRWLNIDAQTNIGIDVWFRVEHPELGNATAEIFIFFDMNGMGSLGVGSHFFHTSSVEGQGTWMFMMYHHTQMTNDVWKEVTDLNLNEQIQYFKKYCGNPYMSQSTFYTIGIDCLLEGNKANAAWVFDYCYYYVED